MNLSRRQSFRLFAGAVITPSVVVGAAPLVAAATKMSPQERYDCHLAEFKKASQELEPSIGNWHHSALVEGETGRCAVVVTAFRVTGCYEGDGRYEGNSSRWDGQKIKYDVKLIDCRTDGERMFHVSTPMDRMLLPETQFNTFIGKKVGDSL